MIFSKFPASDLPYHLLLSLPCRAIASPHGLGLPEVGIHIPYPGFSPCGLDFFFKTSVSPTVVALAVSACLKTHIP